MLYLYSKGYSNQIGGPNNVAFNENELHNMLLKISTKTLFDQQMILENTLDIWSEYTAPSNDVCIIGIQT